MVASCDAGPQMKSCCCACRFAAPDDAVHGLTVRAAEMYRTEHDAGRASVYA